jgi:hypothetical protein
VLLPLVEQLVEAVQCTDWWVRRNNLKEEFDLCLCYKGVLKLHTTNQCADTTLGAIQTTFDTFVLTLPR